MPIDIPKQRLFSEMNIEEQREKLLKDNPDKLLSIFEFDWNLDNPNFNFHAHILACYRSHYDNWWLSLPDDFENWKIIIIDLAAIREKRIEIIRWNTSNISSDIDLENLVLFSAGVLEYYESNTWTKHIQLVQRDWWTNNQQTIAQWAFTITHWGNFSWNLREDLEVELSEESPFLMKDINWIYFLVTHSLDTDKIEQLIASIEYFLENKYLWESDENYQNTKKLFERKFRWVKYDELWDILRTIIEKRRFQEYTSEPWEIPWVEKQSFTVDWEAYNDFYLTYTSKYNTFDYVAIRRIVRLPEWLESIGRIPQRLYLESSQQNPHTNRLSNLGKIHPIVPLLDNIRAKVTEWMSK